MMMIAIILIIIIMDTEQELQVVFFPQKTLQTHNIHDRSFQKLSDKCNTLPRNKPRVSDLLNKILLLLQHKIF